MLIQRAEIDGRLQDLRIREGRIADIGKLTADADEILIDAAGGALLPGLHDHHMHLFALAAALHSVRCGPPDVNSPQQLREALQAANAGANSWIRGIGYHDSIGVDIDRHWLDSVQPDIPLRIQHRSGRLWILNSAAIKQLRLEKDSSLPTGVEQDTGGELSGRFYHLDDWLRQRLPNSAPALADTSRTLASYGVIGLSDAGPDNSHEQWRLFARARAAGELLQKVWMMGSEQLPSEGDAGQQRGPLKLYLRENALPPMDALIARIANAHSQPRPVAFHCVTRTELVFALAVLEAAGMLPGDRIEHASITDNDSLQQLQQQGLTVVTQPNFVRERGDQYLAQIPAPEQRWLYRGRAFLDAGIALAAGTDAPFGDPDPWLAMRAAVRRRTESGQLLGGDEALTPEQALALFTGRPEAPATARKIHPGAVADLCLLDCPWVVARQRLDSNHVRLTLRDGEVIYQRLTPGPQRPVSG